MACSPGGGRESWQPLNGCVGEAGQNIGEVLSDGDVESAAGFDHGEDGGHAWSGLLVSYVGPVAATGGDSPDILPMSVKN